MINEAKIDFPKISNLPSLAFVHSSSYCFWQFSIHKKRLNKTFSPRVAAQETPSGKVSFATLPNLLRGSRVVFTSHRIAASKFSATEMSTCSTWHNLCVTFAQRNEYQTWRSKDTQCYSQLARYLLLIHADDKLKFSPDETTQSRYSEGN